MKTVININLIKDYIKDNNLTNPEFCKLCKISALTFERIMKDDLEVDLTAIFRISRILDVRLCEMFNGR